MDWNTTSEDGLFSVFSLEMETSVYYLQIGTNDIPENVSPHKYILVSQWFYLF